jgi:hypothetical protein
MSSSRFENIEFGFCDELEKLGFITTALRAAPMAINLLSSAGRRDGPGGSAGLTANTAKSLSESDDPRLRFLGKASGAAAAFKKFRGGDEAYQPSANFASSAPPGQVAS